MTTYQVKDLMVPLSEYAMVSKDATLYEAVMELERAQESYDYDHKTYRHRAILVFDETKKIVGKLSQLDVLRALEPKYSEMHDQGNLQRYGFTRGFMKSLMTHYNLWNQPLDNICRVAGQKKVKDFMYTPTEGEYVEEDATLAVAIHQLVLGHHQSLLVTKGKEIVGILKLTDVFAALFHMMKECAI